MTNTVALPSIVSPTEAASVACAVEGTTLEDFVSSLPAEQVPVYLARLLDAATNIRALSKGLEQRLVVDGQVGQHWTIGSTKYGFFGSQQKGWRDIPNLFSNLLRIGMSPLTLSQAVSELRVTTLRTAAQELTGENRAEALELIEAERFAKGERGSPRFQVLDDKYTKGE